MGRPVIDLDPCLTWYEIATVVGVEMRRENNAAGGKFRDRYAAAEASFPAKMWNGINGTGGECAAAKGLGVYWPGTVGTFHDPDLYGRHGEPLQIRTRPDPNNDLCIRPDDPDDHTYVLVIGRLPRYRLVGCILGADGKRTEWRGRSGQSLVYYVPRRELAPMTALDGPIDR